MQEYKVSAGGTTYGLDLPFFVLATQNPIEQEGTYPLPEAQLDRFMFNIYIDYPDKEDEKQIVMATTSAYDPELEHVLTGEEVLRLQKIVRKVPVAESIVNYAVELSRNSRPNTPEALKEIKDWVNWGGGPSCLTAPCVRWESTCNHARPLSCLLRRHKSCRETRPTPPDLNKF